MTLTATIWHLKVKLYLLCFIALAFLLAKRSKGNTMIEITKQVLHLAYLLCYRTLAIIFLLFMSCPVEAGPREIVLPAIQPDHTFGTYGSAENEFRMPSGVAITSRNEIIILDSGNSRVRVYDLNGNFLRGWAEFGHSGGSLNHPLGVTVNAFGTLAVADTGNNRIVLYSEDGRFLNTWGVYGTAPGQFNYPIAIAMTDNRDLYVVNVCRQCRQ
jgi:hypothetical protein